VFSPQAAPVSAQLAVRVYNAMTRNDDRDPVHPVRPADRALPPRSPDAVRKLSVGNRFPVRNARQLPPDALFERCTAVNEWHGEVLERTGEIPGELIAELVQISMLAWNHRLPEQPGQPFQLGLQHPAVGKLEETQAFIGRSGNHRPERGVDGRGDHTRGVFGAPGRQSEGAREGVAKAAVRLPPGSERHIVQRLALAELPDRPGKAAPAAVRVERHAVAIEEESPDPGRIDVEGAQVTVAEAAIRLVVDRVEERAQPLRRRIADERPAAQTRAIAGKQRFTHRAEEFDVLDERLSRPAGGPAEDSCRSYAGDENSVVGRIAREERTLHFRARRERRREQRVLIFGMPLGSTHGGDHELTVSGGEKRRYRKLDKELCRGRSPPPRDLGGIRSSYDIIRSLRSPFRIALVIATMFREPLLAQRTEFGHLDAAPP
jgi:hypothetical protein